MSETIEKLCKNCHFSIAIKLNNQLSCQFFKTHVLKKSSANSCRMFLPIAWWRYSLTKDDKGNWKRLKA